MTLPPVITRSTSRSPEQPDFIELRRRYGRFAFPATAAFMVWYITYVVCNNWARDFMNTQVYGNINVALVFGLLQFVSTFMIAWLYSRHATKYLDPLSTKLREEFEARPADDHRALLPLATGGNQWLTIGLFLLVVALTLYITFWASRQPRPPTTTTPAADPSPASRTAWPSAATTCRPPRSSASPARSRCTATTASSTPSASWWPGWLRCC